MSELWDKVVKPPAEGHSAKIKQLTELGEVRDVQFVGEYDPSPKMWFEDITVCFYMPFYLFPKCKGMASQLIGRRRGTLTITPNDVVLEEQPTADVTITSTWEAGEAVFNEPLIEELRAKYL